MTGDRSCGIGVTGYHGDIMDFDVILWIMRFDIMDYDLTLWIMI